MSSWTKFTFRSASPITIRWFLTGQCVTLAELISTCLLIARVGDADFHSSLNACQGSLQLSTPDLTFLVICHSLTLTFTLRNERNLSLKSTSELGILTTKIHVLKMPFIEERFQQRVSGIHPRTNCPVTVSRNCTLPSAQFNVQLVGVLQFKTDKNVLHVTYVFLTVFLDYMHLLFDTI